MKQEQKICQTHQQQFQLIGADKKCSLNCLICCSCFRMGRNPHKEGGINHKTISVQELDIWFAELKQSRHDRIVECREKINSYTKGLLEGFVKYVEQERKRLEDYIMRIVLSEISNDMSELSIMHKIYKHQLYEFSCQDISNISNILFHKSNRLSDGYKVFNSYIDGRQKEIKNYFDNFVESQIYQRMMLKNFEEKIQASLFSQKLEEFSTEKNLKDEDNESIPDLKRYKTEGDEIVTSKKTVRRSLRKSSKLREKYDGITSKNLLDAHIQICKPLDLADSSIVKKKQENQFIQKLFTKKIFDAKLLYKASDNKFAVPKFHELCDDVPHTLVLVQTQFGKIIGGYTPIAWKSTKNTLHPDLKRHSFIFSLSLKQKMPLIDEMSATFNSISFGPTFGSGADLSICHNANKQKTSYAQFPYSYANDRYKEASQHSTALFTGQKFGKHFYIKQWEVWKMEFFQ